VQVVSPLFLINDFLNEEKLADIIGEHFSGLFDNLEDRERG
jgi:hypothetical protein